MSGQDSSRRGRRPEQARRLRALGEGNSPVSSRQKKSFSESGPRAFYVGEIPRNGWKIMDVAYRMSCRGAQDDLMEIRVAEDLRARVGGLKKTRGGYDMWWISTDRW